MTFLFQENRRSQHKTITKTYSNEIHLKRVKDLMDLEPVLPLGQAKSALRRSLSCHGE